jgi:hypothetical protein
MMTTSDSPASYISVSISCFFPLNSSKHSNDAYRGWLTNFFLNVGRSPTVIFTPAHHVASMDAIAQQALPNVTRSVIYITDYNSPFEFPPIAPYVEQYRTRQRELDPERSKHNEFLYAIWNGKSFMVMETIRRNHFPHARYFWYHDAGSWRNSPRLITHGQWPQDSRVMQLEQRFQLNVGDEPRVILQAVPYILTMKEFVPTKRLFAGGFFGGTRDALAWFTGEFYAVHSEWLRQDRFVGKDQSMMNDIALRNPTRVFVIQAATSNKGDPWFFFQPFLVDDEVARNHSVAGDRQLRPLEVLIAQAKNRTANATPASKVTTLKKKHKAPKPH